MGNVVVAAGIYLTLRVSEAQRLLSKDGDAMLVCQRDNKSALIPSVGVGVNKR